MAALWGHRKIDKTLENHEEAISLVDRLTKAIDELANKSDTVRLNRTTTKLKEDLVNQEIQHKKKQEEWDREKRETEHMIGLQRTRGEQELELAKQAAAQERDAAVREAQLAVREGNLETKESMIKEQMEALQADLRAQIDYLKREVLDTVIKAVPNFNVDMILDPHGSRDAQAAREAQKPLPAIEAGSTARGGKRKK